MTSCFNRRDIGRWLILFTLGVAAMVCVPQRAGAQMAAARAMGGIQSPNISARQLKVYSEILGLSVDQKQAAEALLEGYENEYRTLVRKLEGISKAMQEDFQQSGDMEIYMDVMPGLMKKFQARTNALERTFFDDVKSLLDAGQMDRWPRVERRHRRETTTSWGTVSGESVDLTSVVEGLNLDAAAAAPIAGLLEQYEADLDREIVSRNAVVQEQMDQMWEGMKNFDAERMQKQAQDLRTAGARIRDLNQRYARQVREQLPQDRQAAFDAEVRVRSFPRVYRPSHTGRSLAAALALKDLDDSQRQGLASIKETYERELGTINEKMAAAISEQESSPDASPWGGMVFMPGQKEPEAIASAKQTKQALDDRTLDSINGLLNESQRSRLPDKKNRPEYDLDTFDVAGTEDR